MTSLIVLPLAQYRPFVTPLPVWDWWLVTLVPLAIAVAVVYKTMKCQRLSDVPRQAFWITLWILGGMGVAAALLAVIVRIL